MCWSPPLMNVKTVKISPPDPISKNVIVTMGGSGFDGPPASYSVYLVQPHVSAITMLNSLVSQDASQPPPEGGAHTTFKQPSVEFGANVISPGQDVLQCTVANPPAGSYRLVYAQIKDQELYLGIWKDAVEIKA